MNHYSTIVSIDKTRDELGGKIWRVKIGLAITDCYTRGSARRLIRKHMRSILNLMKWTSFEE